MGVVISKHEELYNAAQAGDAQRVRALVAQGASTELFKDKKQRTALIVASSHAETYDVAVALLQLGANVRAYRPGKDGGFPLHHAARKGLERTSALLLQWGADPLASNDDGETALDIARTRGFVALVRILEDRVCLFCGSLTQQSGAILEAIASNWFAKKWWVVVLPMTTTSTRPQRLEVILYNSPKSAQPKHTITLSVPPDVLLTKENTPEACVTIGDSKTKTKYKLSADKDADNPSVVLQLYNACLGVPQGPGQSQGPAFIQPVQRPLPPASSSQPPVMSPDKGKDLFTNDDVALELAIKESLRSAAAEGIPVSQDDAPRTGASSGASTSSGTYAGWGYGGWVAPSRPNSISSPQTAATSATSPAASSAAPSAQATPTQEESTYSGWGGGVPTSASQAAAAAPSAPPLPVDEAIHYPVVGEEEAPGKSEGLCVVCMDAPSNAVCIPCGHVAGCLSCLTEVQKKGWGCPVCRTPIREVVKVYMATG